MTRRRIDRFLNESLEEIGAWLKVNDWRGKEYDCVNLFAHKFLFERIEPGAAIECPTQVSIECSLRQPERYARPAARKDLVIWGRPLQNTWSRDWEPVHSPKAVMEWKVFRDRLPRAVFAPHDEEWVAAYTCEQAGLLGYVVSVDFASQERAVYWKQARAGRFSEMRRA